LSTTTRLTFEEYEKLPEQQGVIYELDEGELSMEPSPALRHNLIQQRISTELMTFVVTHQFGVVVQGMDFRLAYNVVRNPDVAFIPAHHLASLDLDCSPVNGAPALAIEVVSPSNRAEDMTRKIHQYLAAGSKAVWIFYASLRLVEIHSTAGVRNVRQPEVLRDDNLFPGWLLSLTYVFDGKT
jgi:Uma2 family endonuclease